jgi:hypothetical protein
MSTDYTAALTGVLALIVVFTAMVGFVLSRPSDLPVSSR